MKRRLFLETVYGDYRRGPVQPTGERTWGPQKSMRQTGRFEGEIV
jgi:hypothetical protein